MTLAGRWATGYSVPGGLQYQIWERSVPRIADAYTRCAVYVYRKKGEAQMGESFGGSGFLVSVPFEANPEFADLYVVTNRHVIAEAKTPVLRLNRNDGGIECVETDAAQWAGHADGDDIAVLRWTTDWQQLKFSPVRFETFLTPERIATEDVGIGDDTVMVGRFIGHDGKQQNTPAVRFGNVAMMPQEKIVSKTGVAQESFLVEMRSLPGYSGSAVFLYSPCAVNDMSRRRKGLDRSKGDLHNGQEAYDALLAGTEPKGPYLLGIDWCHLCARSYVRGQNGELTGDGSFVEQNSGMAGVIPAWKLADILNSEEFVKARRETDEELTRRKSESPVSLDVAGEEDASEKFTQRDFENVLTKVSRKTEDKGHD